MVVGGILPVVNVRGLAVDRALLQLDGATLGAVMLGAIQRRGDPRIVELNEGTRFPSLPIKRIVRADRRLVTLPSHFHLIL